MYCLGGKGQTSLQLVHEMVCDCPEEGRIGGKVIAQVIEGGHQGIGHALGEVWRVWEVCHGG